MTPARAGRSGVFKRAVDNLQLKTLGTGFAVAGLLLGLLIVSSSIRTVSDVARVGQTWNDFESGPATKYVYLNQLRGAIGYGGMIHDFKNYILRRDRPRLVRIQAKIRDVIVFLTAYRAVGVTARESQALDAIERVIGEYYRMVATAERMVAEGASARQIDRVVEVSDVEAWSALAVLDEEIEAARDANSQSIGRSVRSIQRIVTGSAIGIGGLLLVLALGLFWFTRIHVAGPLGSLVGIVNRLSAGDTSVHIPAQDRKDEIGDMNRAVQVFKSNSVELSKRTRSLAEAQSLARIGSWERDLATGEATWSEENFRLLGVGFQDPSHELFLSAVHPDDRMSIEEAARKSIDTGEPLSSEIRVIHANGTVRILHVRAEVVRKHGEPVRIVGTSQDITERSQARAQIEASLREKEVLLKEIHHRVKNNLQVVSSLLTLQAATTDDEMVKGVLHESQRRISAMATVHETLYGHESLSQLDCRAYVDSLTEQLLGIYHSNVVLDLTVSGYLPIDEAMPVGLIISELVSNALEHAFPPGHPGTITLVLGPRDDGSFLLRVADDGVGTPAQLTSDSGTALGRRLVSALVDQLDGVLTLTREGGTCIEITFPSSAKTRPPVQREDAVG